MVLGAGHHEVVLAGGLGDRKTHHGADVASQLADGLEPAVERELGWWWWGGLCRAWEQMGTRSLSLRIWTSPPSGLGVSGEWAQTQQSGRTEEQLRSSPPLGWAIPDSDLGTVPWRPAPSQNSHPPAELPDADGVARGGVQHGARGAEGDLVDLVIALGTGDGAGGCGCTGIT